MEDGHFYTIIISDYTECTHFGGALELKAHELNKSTKFSVDTSFIGNVSVLKMKLNNSTPVD